MNRWVMGGLAVVAGCAAVLSFSAIRDLALACGFATSLAWLLPVCVDVGAAVATALWLATDAPQVARDYARVLALVSLVASVAANGLSHGLSAYQLAPPWWVVVLVSAVPAAVLGACVHLVVLARQQREPEPVIVAQPAASPAAEPPEPEVEAPAGWTFEAAVAWAARENAGAKRIQAHTGLSEYKSKKAAAEAKATRGLRVAR